jgi:hypothetical protein
MLHTPFSRIGPASHNGRCRVLGNCQSSRLPLCHAGPIIGTVCGIPRCREATGAAHEKVLGTEKLGIDFSSRGRPLTPLKQLRAGPEGVHPALRGCLGLPFGPAFVCRQTHADTRRHWPGQAGRKHG